MTTPLGETKYAFRASLVLSQYISGPISTYRTFNIKGIFRYNPFLLLICHLSVDDEASLLPSSSFRMRPRVCVGVAAGQLCSNMPTTQLLR
jgi:hypothetical protein